MLVKIANKMGLQKILKTRKTLERTETLPRVPTRPDMTVSMTVPERTTSNLLDWTGLDRTASYFILGTNS
jgi:hypothetical protein